MSAEVRMVDVGDREETAREATARCVVRTTPALRERLLAGTVAKGDAVRTAQIAGMLAAKRTPELLPMCHPVRTTSVRIDLSASGTDSIVIDATVRGVDRTGFEMEALTAASIAALTLHDMGKSEDPAMVIDHLRVVAKRGGRSGGWSQP